MHGRRRDRETQGWRCGRAAVEWTRRVRICGRSVALRQQIDDDTPDSTQYHTAEHSDDDDGAESGWASQALLSWGTDAVRLGRW